MLILFFVCVIFFSSTYNNNSEILSLGGQSLPKKNLHILIVETEKEREIPRYAFCVSLVVFQILLYVSLAYLLSFAVKFY